MAESTGLDGFDDVTGRLREHGVSYTVHAHADLDRPVRSPHDVAAALGIDIGRIVKTLFVVAKSDRASVALVALSVDARVDFKAVAAAVGWSKAETGTPAELAAAVGFPPFGVAPVAAEPIVVVVDDAVFGWPSILVGSGRAGVELEIDPSDLLRLPNVVRASIAREARP